MTTRRPIKQLAAAILKQLNPTIVVNPAMVTTPSYAENAEKILAEFIQDWLDEDQAALVIKEDTSYYVVKFDHTNIHCQRSVAYYLGFSFLKKGDAFDFSKESFARAGSGGSRYVATSDFKNGRICANVTYDPEI